MAPRATLPRRLTSFVGREAAIVHVQQLLASSPLVTLVGAGGVGKTRLALEVAARQTTFEDGVRLAELAGITDAMLVGPVVGAELLVTAHALLVLDNCEHVVDACA